MNKISKIVIPFHLYIVFQVLQEVASRNGAILHSLESVMDEIQKMLVGSSLDVMTTLLLEETAHNTITDTDELNAKISMAALWLLHHYVGGVFDSVDIFSETVQSALTSRPPCRWEVHNISIPIAVEEHSVTTTAASTLSPASTIEVEVILDIGHNPAALGALSRRLKRDLVGKNIRVLYAMSRDKDVRNCLREISTVTSCDRIHFAQSKNFRAISKAELAAIFKEETGQEMADNVTENISTRELIRSIIQLAAADGSGSAVIICGTAYIMPDAKSGFVVIIFVSIRSFTFCIFQHTIIGQVNYSIIYCFK